MNFKSNTLCASLLAFAFSVLVAACASTGSTQSAPIGAERHARLQIAMAMYQERCKRAGVRIYETAENVAGVFLMKLRPGNINYSDQFKFDDPYGRDLGGEGYFHGFLRGSPKSAAPIPGAPPRNGYLYVEAIDPIDGKRYRYTGRVKEVVRTTSILMGGDGKTTFKDKAFVLDKNPALGVAPRYGVTYEDLSTREEREYWIAGSSLKVIDLQSNKVMAERIGYMIDLEQGDTGGGRAPWLLAANNACPGFQRNALLPLDGKHDASAQPLQTLDFVETVLKPKLEK